MTLKLATAEKEYSQEEVKSLCESMIELRNGALEQSDFHWSVVLSHVIAVMSCVVEAMEE